MKHLEVLVVTKKTPQAKVMNWKISTVDNVETAIESLQQRPYSVVAISNGISKTDKNKLNQIINILFKHLVVIEYNNDTALSETVKTAYWRKNRPNLGSKYLDNALEMELACKLDKN